MGAICGQAGRARIRAQEIADENDDAAAELAADAAYLAATAAVMAAYQAAEDAVVAIQVEMDRYVYRRAGSSPSGEG